MSKVGVLALVPDSWGGPWQIRHQILTRLGNYFEVLWVEDPPGWRELFLDTQIRQWAVGIKPDRQKSFSVYKPDKWVPRIYHPTLVGNILLRWRFNRARNFLLEKGCDKIVLYLWRPNQLAALDLVEHDFSCYHIDDEYSFSEVETPIDPLEAKLIASVDQVFICSKAMQQKKGDLNPNTMIVTNGVDYKAYAQNQIEPKDLASIPHPRIGYVGIIKKQMDLELLVCIAKRHPEWSLVMVGPKGYLGDSAASLATLEGLPNVYLMGRKSVEELPAYTQHLDVCLLCYKIDGYTKFIYPLKLHEYLASGKPVIGPPIHSLEEFKDVICLAKNSETDWSAAISKALNHDADFETKAEERRTIAKKFDWEILTANVFDAIEKGLEKKGWLGHPN